MILVDKMRVANRLFLSLLLAGVVPGIAVAGGGKTEPVLPAVIDASRSKSLIVIGSYTSLIAGDSHTCTKLEGYVLVFPPVLLIHVPPETG